MTNSTDRESFMTVVFKTDVESFDKNPMHIKTEFGEIAAISRGDVCAELEASRAESAKEIEALKRENNRWRASHAQADGGFSPDWCAANDSLREHLTLRRKDKEEIGLLKRVVSVLKEQVTRCAVWFSADDEIMESECRSALAAAEKVAL